MDHVTRPVLGGELLPGIGFEVLDGQRQTTVLAVDARDNRVDLLTFLQHLARMLDAARPRNVGNVNQAVDSIFNFDKGAEVRQVPHAAVTRVPT